MFLYSARKNNSFPFTQGGLSNKNGIREMNRKMLGAVLIDTWIREETSLTVILVSLFRGQGIELPEGNNL